MVVLKWKNKTILFSPTAIGFVSWKRSSWIRHTFMAVCLPHNKFFSPIWANWACFARGRTARHPFFKLLSQHTVKDAFPGGTWLGALNWWRKVGKDRRRRKKAQCTAEFKPPNLLITRLAVYWWATTVSHRIRFFIHANNLQLLHYSWQHSTEELNRNWIFSGGM